MEVDDNAGLIHPKVRIWPFALGAIGLVALAIAAWLSIPPAIAPYRVYVSAAPAQSAFAAAVASELRAASFEVILGTESDADAVLEAARVQLARHAVLVSMETIAEREGSDRDPAYMHARGAAQVMELEGAAPLEVTSVELAAFGSDPSGARDRVGEKLGEAMGPALLMALFERESVQDFLTTTRLDNEELPTQSGLRAVNERIPGARTALEAMRSSCEESGEALSVDAESGVLCVSDPCAEEYAFDVLADGSAALVHSENPSARIPIALGLDADRVETVERIDVVPLDGSERQTIATSTNYYTYPSVSADGRTVVAVEEWPRGFGLVAIDVASGARTVLQGHDDYVQAPEVSPDGSRVLAYVRRTRRAPAQLMVMPIEPDAQGVPIGVAHLATWVEIGERTLVAESVERDELVPEVPSDELVEGDPEDMIDDLSEEPPDAEEELPEGTLPTIEHTRRLALLDPDGGGPVAWLDDDTHELTGVAGIHDGRVVLGWRNGSICGVGRWEPFENDVIWVRTHLCLRHPRLLPDGRLVGDARNDVVLLEIDGTHRYLTDTELRERYPRPARMAGRIIFDRLGERVYRHFPRVAVCSMDPG